MNKNYILNYNLKYIVGKITKFLHKLNFVIFLLGLAIPVALKLLFPLVFLSPSVYTYFVIFSYIPAFLFVYTFYIYENLYFLRKISWNLIFKSLLWLGYLSVPSFLMIFRYSEFLEHFPIQYVSVVTAIIFIITGGNWDTNKIISTSRLFKDIRYIMSEYWDKKNLEIEKQHFELEETNQREDFYFDKNGISTFQKTISCPYIDTFEIINNYGKLVRLTENYKVLDIGGADGIFTSLLLNEIKKKYQKKPSKIQIIDPADFTSEYKQQVSSIINSSNVFFTVDKFESWDRKFQEKYNLIIASHSFYSAIDNKTSTIEELLSKLKSLLEPNGIIIIILSSKESRAYNFKRNALSIVFGEDLNDLNGTVLKQKLADYTTIKVDNYINLTDIVNEYNSGNSENLVAWLCYFLRADIKKLKTDSSDRIIRVLKNFIQQPYELPECMWDNFIQKDKNPILLDKNNSKILTHKTEITFID